MCFWRRCFFNLASLLERLGTLLGHFGTLLGFFRVQKRAPKSSDAQQAAVFGSSEGSGRLPGTIFDGIGTILGCFLLDGSTIFAISTCSIFGKCWIWEAFWEAKSSQNPKKHAFKNMCYFSIVFFLLFWRFWQHFGRSGRSSMVPSYSQQLPSDSYLQYVRKHWTTGRRDLRADFSKFNAIYEGFLRQTECQNHSYP